jgi:two-component system C4-dicarboxylate transport response regulator DctD
LYKQNESITGYIHRQATEPLALGDQVKMFEKHLIEQALIENKGSIQDAMEALNIPRRTLNEKMRIYDLDRKNYI